jgi:hypothetical protein
MAPRRRKHLDRARSGAGDRRRSGTIEGSRKVTDHAARAASQSQLDPPVQVLDAITEAAGDLQDHDLTNGVRPGPNLPTRAGPASRRLRDLGRDIGLVPRREQHDMVVELFRKVR